MKITLKSDLGKEYRFKKYYSSMFPKATVVTLIGITDGKFDFLLYATYSGRAGILLTPKQANEFLEEVEPVTIYRKVKKGAKK